MEINVHRNRLIRDSFLRKIRVHVQMSMGRDLKKHDLTPFGRAPRIRVCFAPVTQLIRV